MLLHDSSFSHILLIIKIKKWLEISGFLLGAQWAGYNLLKNSFYCSCEISILPVALSVTGGDFSRRGNHSFLQRGAIPRLSRHACSCLFQGFRRLPQKSRGLSQSVWVLNLIPSCVRTKTESTPQGIQGQASIDETVYNAMECGEEPHSLADSVQSPL
jgi:hypothetical protein